MRRPGGVGEQHPGNARPLLVAARHQTGPGGTADVAARLEVEELHAFPGHAVEPRGVDPPVVGADIAVAEVVGHDDHDVRRRFRRLRRLARCRCRESREYPHTAQTRHRQEAPCSHGYRDSRSRSAVLFVGPLPGVPSRLRRTRPPLRLPVRWKWQPEKGPLRPREKGPPGLACQHLNPASSERGGARVVRRWTVCRGCAAITTGSAASCLRWTRSRSAGRSGRGRLPAASAIGERGGDERRIRGDARGSGRPPRPSGGRPGPCRR